MFFRILQVLVGIYVLIFSVFAQACFSVSSYRLPDNPLLFITKNINKNQSQIAVLKLQETHQSVTVAHKWQKSIQGLVSEPAFIGGKAYFLVDNILYAYVINSGQVIEQVNFPTSEEGENFYPKLSAVKVYKDLTNPILAGVSGGPLPHLFVFQENKNILWQTSLTLTNPSLPQIIKFKNGRWGVMVAGVVNNKLVIYFYALKTGQLLNYITLPKVLSDKSIHKIVAVDTKLSGYVDCIYLTADNELWKINLDANDSKLWFTEKKVYQEKKSQFIFEPQVVQHPSGDGYIIYTIVKKANRYQVLAILDNAGYVADKLLWVYASHQPIHQLLVRNGQIVIHQQDNSGKLIMVNGETGSKIREDSIQPFYYLSKFSTNIMNALREESIRSQKITVLRTQPKSLKNYLLLESVHGVDIAVAPLDFFKLGRKSWREY